MTAIKNTLYMMWLAFITLGATFAVLGFVLTARLTWEGAYVCG